MSRGQLPTDRQTWPPKAGVTRRGAVAGGLMAAMLMSRRVAAETATLRQLAAAKGLLYGTTISGAQITSDPAFVGLVLRQTAIIVPENDMKWQDINRGGPGEDDYSGADTIAGFAVEGGLALRGHNLLWYFRTPRLVFRPPRTCRRRRRRSSTRIRTLAGRYRGLVHSWDVVNEPIEPKDGRPDGLRKAVFLETFGPEYLDLAYRVAHEADPGARLVVNEYDIEFDTPENEARRTTLAAPPRTDAAGGHAGRRGRHRGASYRRRRPALFGRTAAAVSPPRSPIWA